MKFQEVIDDLISLGYRFEVAGFMNVEGGNAAVATNFYDYCDCTALKSGPITEICTNCDRKPGSQVTIRSGDGDGVYVVARIVHKTDSSKNVGAFVFFDYQFGIANAVHGEIAKQKVSEYPLDIALKIQCDKVIELGNLKNRGSLFFGDGTLSSNSRDAIVDIQNLAQGDLTALMFAETVESTGIAWAERLAQTQGMDRASVEASLLRAEAGSKAAAKSLGSLEVLGLPSFVPRCLMVLQSQVAKATSVVANYSVDDWELLGLQFQSTVVTSNVEPQNMMCIWQNAMLAREIDRAAGDTDYEKTKSLLFDMWTWGYQGAELGDEDCLKLVNANSYKATPHEVASLLNRRGMYKAAAKHLGEKIPEPGLANSVQKICSNCENPHEEQGPLCRDCSDTEYIVIRDKNRAAAINFFTSKFEIKEYGGKTYAIYKDPDDPATERIFYFMVGKIFTYLDVPFYEFEKIKDISQEFGPWGLGKIGVAATYHTVVPNEVIYSGHEIFEVLLGEMLSDAKKRESELRDAGKQ